MDVAIIHQTHRRNIEQSIRRLEKFKMLPTVFRFVCQTQNKASSRFRLWLNCSQQLTTNGRIKNSVLNITTRFKGF